MEESSTAERLLPSYHPEQLVALVGDENTELPDDVVEAMLNIMRAHADIEAAPYIGYYTPAQIEYFSKQSQLQLTPLPANRNIIHIHNLGRHWVTTYYSAHQKRVYICDSLKTHTHKQQVEAQVKMIYGDLSRKIEHVSVIQQSTQPLCGPLAIAFAVAYFLHSDPSKLQFDLSKVNRHLKNCLLQGTVTQFPTVNTDKHLLSSYFATQFELQQKKSQEKVKIVAEEYDKLDKRKLQKELDRLRKQKQRLKLTDIERNTLKEKDMIRKRTERENIIDKHKKLDNEKYSARKKKERLNKPELQQRNEKEKYTVRRQTHRKNRPDLEKQHEKEKDVLRKRSERINRPDSEKQHEKEKDVLRKRSERINRPDSEKHHEKVKDVLRKRSERINRPDLEKLHEKEKERLRKSRQQIIKTDTRKQIDKDKNTLRKKIERQLKSECLKEINKQKDSARKSEERKNQDKKNHKKLDSARKRLQRYQKAECEKDIAREKDCARKRRKILEKTENEKDIHREMERARKRSKRYEKTGIEQDVSKEKDTVRKRCKRSQKTDVEKEMGKEKDSARKRYKRSEKTDSEKEKTKEKDSARKKYKRSEKTDSEKERTKEKDSARKRYKRSENTDSEKERTKKKDSARKRYKRSEKTDSEKEKTKEKDSARKRYKRKEKTDTDKDYSREQDAHRKRVRRHEKSSLNKQIDRERETTSRRKMRSSPSVQTCVIQFLRAIKDGALYECNFCARLMFRGSVLKYVPLRYTNKDLIRNIVTVRKGSITDWICQTCDSALKKNSIPSLCLTNNLSLEKIPQELKRLTSMELQLISQILPFMKVVALHTGAQHKISGQVVLVPADLSKISTSLPRNTANAQIITLALKRRLSDKHPYHQQIIRPSYVNEAITYLKSHSPLYSQVQLNSNWEQHSAEQSAELWTAVNSQNINSSEASVEEIIQQEDTPVTETSNVTGDKNDKGELTDSEDEVDCGNPFEIQEELLSKASLNAVTCVQPMNGPEVQTRNILNIAPAEGQTPTTCYKQPEWEALSFPKLFPTGLNSYNTNRPTKLSLKKYFNQRLTNKDTRFAETTEYIFQALDATEREQLQNSISLTTRKTLKNDVNAGQLKDPGRLTRLITNDQLFTSFKNIRATPQYWQQMQLDMLAKLRQLGPYTFFLTGSAAEFHWVEVIQIVAKQYGTNLSDQEIENMDWATKRSWLQRNPVTVARQIDFIFEQLFSKVILSGAHPIGQILNYDKRKEMQGRGTEHFHCALHVKDSPKLDTNSDKECIQFIDQYITCEMPDPEKDEQLYSLVQRQVHHHTRTCKKNKNKVCRFSYPRAPSPQTVIARVPEGEDSSSVKKDASSVLQKVHDIVSSCGVELGGKITIESLLQKAGVSRELYLSALQVAQRRTTVIMKRSPQEVMVNNYNTTILRALRANMDIQYITNIWACIAYLTSYICKPEKNMSEMMKKASKEASSKLIREALNDIGHIFLKAREVSEHEAISRILSLPLRKSNVDVQFIQTDIPQNRTRVLKPRHVLQQMEDDETDIFLPSVHEKYANRPDILEGICLADFVSKYTIGSDSQKNNEENQEVEHDNQSKTRYLLKNGMGVLSKRSIFKVIRYHNVSKQRDEEIYFHRLLILYLPWRSEDELILDNSFKKMFEHVKNLVSDNIKTYEPYNDEVENVIENFDPDDAGPEMWAEIGAQALQEADNNETDSSETVLPLLDPDNLEACAVHPETQKKLSTFSLTVTNLSRDTEFLSTVRDLNLQQRTLFDYLYTWATNKRLQPQSTEPFYIFLTGGAGCGKTFLINTVYEGLVRALRFPGQDPEKPTVLMTASTGKAASNISGMTVHSAFGLPVRKHKNDISFTYKPPDQSRLNTMRCNFTNLKVIVTDEISMLGSSSFSHLSCALQDIFQNYSKPFAGISVLVVGDLLQLNPVGQSPVFTVAKQGYDALAGSLWQKLFKLYELTTIVRQKGDPRFAEILNNIRVGTLTSEDEENLKDLENTDISNFPEDTVHLFRTNELAAVYNEKQLKKLPGPHTTIQCQDTRKDLHTNSVPVTVTSTNIYETGGLPSSIEVAVGAPFMLTKNIDTADHLVNGVIGTIQHIDILPDNPLQGCIYLKFEKSVVGKELKKSSPSGLRKFVPIKAVSSTFFITDKKTVPVERKMFPGILAYALTVHKSQGSTYAHLIADFQKPKNAPKMATPQGLAYTMLSRATSRTGIQVLNFNKSDITVNKKALDEIKRMQTESVFQGPALDKTSLYIGHINIRSLTKHACDLISDPAIRQMAVLCLAETNMKTCPRKTYIPDYEMLLNNRNHGLAFFIKQDLVYNTLHFNDSDIEISGIMLQYHCVKYNIIVVYKPPTFPVQTFLKSLETHVKNLENLVILGDCNQTGNTETFSLFLHKNGYHQYITTPTHSLGDTLDLIISPMADLQTITKPLPYTDHHLVAVKLGKSQQQFAV